MTAPDAHGWEPIDTAPTDGEEVLVAFGGREGPPPAAAAYLEGHWILAGTTFALVTPPTHWQRLPEPPVIFAYRGGHA